MNQQQDGELSIEDLSALVAVKFLGHKWVRDRNDEFHEGGIFLCSPNHFRQFEARYIEADESDKGQRRSNDRHWADNPAEDIAAAMQVVEKFTWPISVMMEHDRYYYGNETQEGWRVTIRDPLRPVSAICKTLPEAIARAALQAIQTKE